MLKRGRHRRCEKGQLGSAPGQQAVCLRSDWNATARAENYLQEHWINSNGISVKCLTQQMGGIVECHFDQIKKKKYYSGFHHSNV